MGIPNTEHPIDRGRNREELLVGAGKRKRRLHREHRKLNIENDLQRKKERQRHAF